MDDPEFWDHYFIDYFDSIVKLGKIGPNRQYTVTDYVGMNKSTAMDIAEIQSMLYKNITDPTFEMWFETIKYGIFYNSIHIYLFSPYHHTSVRVENWFRIFYMDNI